jgi:hypothetical protein
MNSYIDFKPPQPSSNTQGAFNNALASAQADADPRYNMKGFDRAGMSRGKGQAAAAGAQAANTLAKGVAAAYQIPTQDAVADARNTLAYQQSMEQGGLQASSIAMQNTYANALAALQRQQNAVDFQGKALDGLFGGIPGGGPMKNLDSFLGF